MLPDGSCFQGLEPDFRRYITKIEAFYFLKKIIEVWIVKPMAKSSHSGPQGYAQEENYIAGLYNSLCTATGFCGSRA